MVDELLLESKTYKAPLLTYKYEKIPKYANVLIVLCKEVIISSGVARVSQWGGLGADSPTLSDFCNFSIKIILFYEYFG